MKKTNKLISILLVLAMMLSMAPLSLTASAALTPTAIGGCDGNHSGYTEINSKKTITQAGNYYLTGNVSVNDYSYPLKIQCSGTVTLCLNGYDLYHAGNGNCVVEIRATGGDLTVNLCDCKGTGEIYHNKRKDGIYLFGDDSNGYYTTLNMYGGTIRDCSSGVDEIYNTRFNMYGGTIKNCSKYGVFQSQYDGKVNIYGGTITGNTEGIWVCSADAVTLTGSPIISGNTNGDLYFRNNNSPIIVKNLSVNEKITIAQYTAADCAVVKVDSEEAYDCFEALDPNARVISHNDNTIWFHGAHLWEDANCTEPKTCQSCGMTEGDPLGHDWSNLDGICANGCGLECDHENQTGEICEICGKSLHTHSFTYTASGDTITAVCTTEGCDLENGDGGYITISAPADLYADGTAKEATVENNLADTSVAVNVTYSTADGKAPTTAGTYTASVTIGGATATVQFEIIKRSSTAENFIYTAPENLVYDGTPKYATVEVSPEITGMGEITVSYYQNGETVEPINAGTYTVKVSAAESDKYYAINGVELGSFTIEKKAVTATAIAPDKQYNGIGNIDKSKITIVLEGIVYGESVETAVETAWIEGEAVGKNYLVPVFFSVSGDAAKNYSFPINELYPTEFYYAEATVNIYNDFTPKKGTEYTVNSNDWINTDFVITAKEGYQLSLDNELNGWSDILSKSEETENGSITFYVMNKETGAISLAATENYKIDKTMPHGYFSDSHGRGYDYLLLDEIQTEPYYENEDIFTHKYEVWDDASGIANMEYYFSSTKLTKAELDSVSGWTEFDLDIDIEDIFEFPGDETYSYIRVTDNAGNIIYYVAHLVYDGEMAKINGVLYGFTYYTTQIISVTDNFKLDYATVNGEVVKSGYDAITLAGNCDATYEIFTYDLAGNPRAEAIITMKPIATLSEPIDNLKEETIKSSDKETIEAVKAKVEKIDTTDATDDEKAELQKILDKCDALIKKIADIQAEIDRLGKTVASYTEETVKSTDSEDLEQLKEDIQALIDSTNTTENEKTALGEMIEKINALLDKISETEEKLEEIKSIENNYNPENITSDDKAAIEEKIAEIEALNPDNLTDEQKAEYEELKAEFEALLEEIAAAENAVADIGVELEMFNEERVTIFWEDEIEALKAKIDELLADENMGEAEKAKLNEYKAQAEKLIEIINDPCEYFSMRLFFFVWDALNWLSSHVVFIFNWIVAMF